MGAISPSRMSFGVLFLLLAFCIFCEIALAQDGGITRHYKFNVCMYYIRTISIYILYIDFLIYNILYWMY